LTRLALTTKRPSDHRGDGFLNINPFVVRGNRVDENCAGTVG
jgi:hypothetical protein